MLFDAVAGERDDLLYLTLRISNYLRSFGPMALVRRLVPAPGLDGKLTAFG